jgi:hypothetical protein
MREHMLEHMDGHAAEILCRLEDVRSAEEAQDAARAFRTWIASALLATPSDTFKTPGAERGGTLRASEPRRPRSRRQSKMARRASAAGS